ncbi:hypothetical protein J7E50_20820 [Pedobacter sp. ISL-68]|uniref:hypothetical protein n=1 Tax=unclassified Pedobacter TaxID=2628915 RepID=UPI001BE674B1|nr:MULTISPECIES: hypothetical protein [unclassified Pedobacter]MBT2563920.1 hypothetical protein [Pedobacter sp. ISL-64]MBT2592674.1 hypothetical protein [Pedobacter sp. ISL-68]
MATEKTDFTKAVVRSAAYPSQTMETAFEFTKKIYNAFGSSSHNTRESIAKVLNMSPNYLTVPLSNATQYGFLEMKSKIGYNPTELFIRYYKPETEDEKWQAQLESFRSPKLYEVLLNIYAGSHMPSVDALAVTLFRKHNIAENTSKKAAEIFIENLKFLNLIDGNNKMKSLGEVSSKIETITPEFEDYTSTDTPSSSFKQLGTSHEEYQPITLTDDLSLGIKLQDGRRAKLIYPDGIVNADWDKIIRVISAMKDDE